MKYVNRLKLIKTKIRPQIRFKKISQVIHNFDPSITVLRKKKRLYKQKKFHSFGSLTIKNEWLINIGNQHT